MKNWDLLAKYVSDECSYRERMEIERWMQHHPENEAFMERVRRTWNYSDSKSEFFMANTAKAKQSIWNRIEGKEKSGNSSIPPPLNQLSPDSLEKDTAPLYKTLRRLAIAIVAGLAFVVIALLVEGPIFNSSPKMIHRQTAIGEKSMLTLSDGTQVWLNENSEIHYPEMFTGETRNIEMKGEAFFNVEKNPARPFTIRIGNIVTKVLGTSFNIDAQDENGGISVHVVSGRVLFFEEENEDRGVVLIQGEKATYRPEGNTIEKNKVHDENFLAWHTGLLTFDNSTLEEVAATLSELYGKEISASADVKDCHYTATFHRKSLNAVLENLRESLGIEAREDGEKIVLDGDGC